MFKSPVIVFIFLLCLAFAGCKRAQKFDRDKWDDGDGLTYQYRDGMLDDLVKNVKLKGLKYQQVIHLLHRPQTSSKENMTYEIDYRFLPNKPKYVKNLILHLQDSVVTRVEVYEHTDKK